MYEIQLASFKRILSFISSSNIRSSSFFLYYRAFSYSLYITFTVSIILACLVCQDPFYNCLIGTIKWPYWLLSRANSVRNLCISSTTCSSRWYLRLYRQILKSSSSFSTNLLLNYLTLSHRSLRYITLRARCPMYSVKSATISAHHFCKRDISAFLKYSVLGLMNIATNENTFSNNWLFFPPATRLTQYLWIFRSIHLMAAPPFLKVCTSYHHLFMTWNSTEQHDATSEYLRSYSNEQRCSRPHPSCREPVRQRKVQRALLH